MTRNGVIGTPLRWIAFAAVDGSAQHQPVPPGVTHEAHLAQMKKDAELKKRGAAAMGFDQDTTTHHFGLTTSGGFIQVEANDPKDSVNREAIRTHLKEISSEFAAGNFSKPFMTHAENPPGVATMQRMKAAIRFRYEDADFGARVRIVTTDAAALRGIHDFLRYQITEHRTGDSLKVQK